MTEKYKQYILARTDKYFPIGKVMAHCSHNAVRNAHEHMYHKEMNFRHIEWYYENDMTTIVLDGKFLKDIYSIVNKAQNMGIPTSFIKDIHLKDRICASIGPVTDKEAEELGLKKLKLY